MINMRYGIIGSGAIGGYYGAKLAHAGQELHFLFRSDYEYVKQHGLHVDSCNGSFHLDDINTFHKSADDIDDRPGAKALKEFGVRSPLRECGITKPEIRKLAKEAGLSVWNKPAYACLATRIPHGELITADKLKTTEKAETLLYEMGFRDFRVRMRGENALVQVTAAQYGEAMARRNDIAAALGTMYGEVIIDDITR